MICTVILLQVHTFTKTANPPVPPLFVFKLVTITGIYFCFPKRNEVVQHRLNFKNAAVNTFNIIELLLRQPHVEEDNLGDMLVHNAVRVGSCPPDLLRYIVVSRKLSLLFLVHHDAHKLNSHASLTGNQFGGSISGRYYRQSSTPLCGRIL